MSVPTRAVASATPARVPAARRARPPLLQLVLSFFLFDLAASMAGIALPLLVLARAGVGLSLGVVLAMQLAPSIVLGGPAGTLVDRSDPQRIAILSSLASATLISLLPLTSAVWQIGLLSLLSGSAQVFGMPARMALRPRVVAPGEELAGNSLIVSAERTTSLAGPLIVGVLAGVVGLTWLFAIVATTAALGAVVLVGLHASQPHGAPAPLADGARGRTSRGFAPAVRSSFVEPFATLVAIMRDDDVVATLTLTAFAYVAAVGMGRVFLAQDAGHAFAGRPGSFAYLVGAMAAGGILGSLLTRRLSRSSPPRLYVVANVLEAVCWPLVAVAGGRWIAFGAIALAGAFESIATVVYFAEVQARLHATAGSYYAVLLPLTSTCRTAGFLLGGALAAVQGPTAIAIAIAALIGVPVVLLAGRLNARAAPQPNGEAP